MNILSLLGRIPTWAWAIAAITTLGGVGVQYYKYKVDRFVEGYETKIETLVTERDELRDKLSAAESKAKVLESRQDALRNSIIENREQAEEIITADSQLLNDAQTEIESLRQQLKTTGRIIFEGDNTDLDDIKRAEAELNQAQAAVDCLVNKLNGTECK